MMVTPHRHLRWLMLLLLLPFAQSQAGVLPNTLYPSCAQETYELFEGNSGNCLWDVDVGIYSIAGIHIYIIVIDEQFTSLLDNYLSVLASIAAVGQSSESYALQTDLMYLGYSNIALAFNVAVYRDIIVYCGGSGDIILSIMESSVSYIDTDDFCSLLVCVGAI